MATSDHVTSRQFHLHVIYIEDELHVNNQPERNGFVPMAIKANGTQLPWKQSDHGDHSSSSAEFIEYKPVSGQLMVITAVKQTNISQLSADKQY